MIFNSKGTVFYGMHFYSGVAEYAEPDGSNYRVYLNDATIREMDPTFAGRPVFVHHVDEVDESLDALKGEVDGWVIESFYNDSDGKHWVKFIVTSEKGQEAVKSGMRLSNAYIPKSFGAGGLWNGVSYAKEITSGEYEHLAMVPNPRYDESVVLTPEQFRTYNERKTAEAKRYANSHKEPKGMKLNFFERKKIENAIDANMSVQLPKSGVERSILQLVNDADAIEEKKKNGEPLMADVNHHVDMGGMKMTVNELMERHKQACNELASMKADKEKDETETEGEDDTDDKKTKNGDDDETTSNETTEAEEDDKELKAAKKKNAADAVKAAEDAKKAKAREKAERLRNANNDHHHGYEHVDVQIDQVEVGKARYGS